MKKLLTLVAAVALLAATTAANAADSAWFTLEGAGGDAVASNSGQGLTLEITKGLASQTLTIGYNLTSASGSLAGWAIALTAAATPGKSVSLDGFTRLGTGYDTPTGGGGVPVDLLTGTFDVGNASITLSGSTGLVLTFDVTITGKTPGSVTQIFGSFGASEQFRSDGYVWYGNVGANAAQYGYAGYSFGNLPVITITNVPEPATMALLGLGVVCLIRRRR